MKSRAWVELLEAARFIADVGRHYDHSSVAFGIAVNRLAIAANALDASDRPPPDPLRWSDGLLAGIGIGLIFAGVLLLLLGGGS